MMPTALNPKNNNWYEELCALGEIGALSASEFNDLQEHLGTCSDCRNLYADFRRVASEDLGLVAVLKRNENTVEEPGEVLERELLSRVLDRASRERFSARSVPRSLLPIAKQRTLQDRLSGLMISLRPPAVSYGSLALILCVGAAIGAYRFRGAQLTPTLQGLDSEVENWKKVAETSQTEEKLNSALLAQAESERDN